MNNVTFYEMPYTDVSVLEVRMKGTYVNLVRHADCVCLSDPFLRVPDKQLATEELGITAAIELLTELTN